MPAVVSRVWSPAELARALIDGGPLPHAPWAARELRAVAWALKDACYAAWSSEPPRTVKAAEALQRLAEEGAADAEVHALADWTAGIAGITRGRIDDALQCFLRAHAAFERLEQADHTAATMVPTMMALSLLGRYDEAIDCAARAQLAFVALGDRRAAGKVSLNLGSLHLHRGDWSDAARHSRHAAVLFARVGDHEHSVMADINWAHALTSLGDFDEALRVYARADMRAAVHAFPVLQAMVEEAVAFLRLARGQYGEALKGFDGARRRYEQLAMPQEIAMAEKHLADTYLELRLLPEALLLFEQSLARFRALQRPDEEAWTLAQRGRVQALLGQVPQAVASFEQAVALFATHGNATGEATVTLARAELAFAEGDAGGALTLATQAAGSFAAAAQIDAQLRAHVVRAHALLLAGSVEQAHALFETTQAQAQTLQLLSVQLRCLTGLGLAAQGAGDAPAAQHAFDAAVELFEEQRRALPDAAMRSAFLGDHLRPYQELLRLALDAHAGAPSPSPPAAAQVLRQLDRFRARALGERVAQGMGGVDSAATRPLRARLNWLHRQVLRLQEEGESSAMLAEALRCTERELLEQARRERLAAPALPLAIDEFDPAELQRHLGDGEVLIEYGVQDDELFACRVDRHGVELHRQLARWSEVLDALRSARFQIETLRHGAAPVVDHLNHLTRRARARLQRLHALVWAPLAPALDGAQRVLVVPQAQLGALPYAALDDGECCLADRHELALAPSARLALRGLRGRPTAPARALVLGESTRLPHAAREAAAVAHLFGGAEAFIGKQATMRTLRAHASRADVIHLACHAQFRSDNPTFSALHLHDGALTVDLVESLEMASPTVVLSGCETGLADADGGDEMVGLVRAFLIAGASRVVASLWPVDDAVTAGFMSHFYIALRRGAAPAAALREAQQAVRREHPHPLYWAAFTLYGGW